MGIENKLWGYNKNVSEDTDLVQYQPMTEPEKDRYKCMLNPMFEKSEPDLYKRMSKVEKVIEEMQYKGLSLHDIMLKYNLEKVEFEKIKK